MTVQPIKLDDYDDAEAHAYALAAKLNEIIEYINANASEGPKCETPLQCAYRRVRE